MSEHSTSPKRAPKVLIVDDERDIVDYLSMVLEDEGFVAQGLTETEGALERIKKEGPDLVLLDVMMPGHTGLSLYRAMREDESTRAIPVLIISGYARQEDFAKMELSELETGSLPPPEGYLEKPIAVSILLATLKRILEPHEPRTVTP